MKLNIYAVGSNSFLAEEIRNAAQLILGPQIPLMTCISSEIINCLDGLLYICNQSQFQKIKSVVPREKIVVLDLMPTSQFYVKVAAIPAGSDVYVFNNKSSYIGTLIDSCRSMGITSVNFIPLPYSELAREEVFAMLKKARYIIGVDYLLNENVLLSPPYSECLHYNTQCIGARRVGSVSSACEIVTKVNRYLYQGISSKLTHIFEMMDQVENTGSLFELYKTLSFIYDGLKNNHDQSSSIEKSAINQIVPHNFFSKADERFSEGGI